MKTASFRTDNAGMHIHRWSARPDRRRRRGATPGPCALLLLLAGCGGGGSSPEPVPEPEPGAVPAGAPGPDAPASAPDGPDEALRGTLWLERRADKLVADAWFVAAAGPVPAGDDGTGCAVDAPGDASPEPSGNARSLDPALLRAPAERVVVASRGVEQLVLEPARLGPAVVYASEARWLREPIAEDARVAVLDEGGDALFDALALDALPDPVLESPAGGRLASLAEPLRWSVGPASSGVPDTRVHVGLTGIVDGRDVRVRCTVGDDGAFEVPAGLVDGEVRPPGWTVVLTRERRVRTSRDGDAFEIVQRVSG